MIFVIGQKIAMKCECVNKRICIDGWRRKEGGLKSENDGELKSRKAFSHVLSTFSSLRKEGKSRKERRLINRIISMYTIFEYLDRCFSLTIQ
jgi:hypothetical protein